MKRYLAIFITILTLYTYSSIFAANAEKSLSFQGQLFETNAPKTGSVNATFTFYDAVTGGSITGSPIAKTVTVNNGYFGTQFSESDTTGVDFNQQLYLEVTINGTTLSPRTSINPTVSSLKTFGTFSYSSAPTVGPAGSLYFNTTSEELYVSNGTLWQLSGLASSTTQWVANGTSLNYMAGNVGIGTTTPSEKLHVFGAGIVNTKYQSSDNYVNFQLQGGQAGDVTWALMGGYPLAGDFSIRETGVQTSLTIKKTTGNVGIGTTTPLQKLEVVGGNIQSTYDANINGQLLSNSSGSGVSFFSGGIQQIRLATYGNNFINSGNLSIGTTTSSARLSITGATGTSDIFTIASSTNARLFTVAANGNVGVGTTTPSEKLHVYGSGIVNTKFQSSDNYVNFQLQGGQAGDVTWALMGGYPLAGDFSIRETGVQTSLTIKKTTGNVGIGTTTPLSKFDVVGDINISKDSAYKYNGQNIAIASTTIFNYFLGGSGNLTATGTTNTALGSSALASLTGGSDNTAIGAAAMLSNTSGYSNTVVGRNAFRLNTTGYQNVAMGNEALYTNSTGFGNTAVGLQALKFNAGGIYNTAFGRVSLGNNSSGSRNTAFGNGALIGNTTGSSSVGIGDSAGLTNTIGSNNTFLGYSSDVLSNNLSNATAIGYNSKVACSNCLVLGGTGADSVFVGIGTTTPGSKFTVAGAINSTDLLGGITTLSVDASGNIIRTPSDQKLKTNIETLTSALDKVNQMRGVSYKWIDTNRFGTSTEIGFIAQELETIVPEVVKSGGEYKSVNYQNLTALLTEAIKELSAKFVDLKKLVETDEVKTKKLCIGDTCITEQEFKQVLQNRNTSSPAPAPTSEITTPTPEPEQPVETPTPEPTSEPLPEPVTPPTE